LQWFTAWKGSRFRVAPHFHGDTHLVDARKGKLAGGLKDAPKFPFGSDARSPMA